MVEIDLRKLSAPIEALRDDVTAAYQRLQSQWEAIAYTFNKLPIPCVVRYTFSEEPNCPVNCECLEWRKWKGKKRFCITTYEGGEGPYGWEESFEVLPYEEWSAEQRLEMLQHVPQLFESAAAQVKEFVKKASAREDK